MRLENPGAIIENTLRGRMLRNYLEENRPKGTLLDLGCGTRPYRNIYANFFEKTLGADLAETPFPVDGVDILCDATAVPLGDASIDFILCTEVLHDLPEPDLFFQEIRRLLKPDGILFLTSPFVVPLVDGRYDHYRYTEQGLRYRIQKSGLQVEEIDPIGDIHASAITLLVKPVLKAFNILAKGLRWPGFYSVYNPAVFLLAALPQMAYLLCRNLPGFRSVFRRFNYGPIGYVSIVRKPS